MSYTMMTREGVIAYVAGLKSRSEAWATELVDRYIRYQETLNATPLGGWRFDKFDVAEMLEM